VQQPASNKTKSVTKTQKSTITPPKEEETVVAPIDDLNVDSQ